MVDTLPASGGAGDELSWHELLRTPLSLTASDPPSGHLDARSLVRLVDKRCRADFRHLQAQAQAASEELAARRRESLASIATLAQRWPLPPPGLGAFTLSAGGGGGAARAGGHGGRPGSALRARFRGGGERAPLRLRLQPGAHPGAGLGGRRGALGRVSQPGHPAAQPGAVLGAGGAREAAQGAAVAHAQAACAQAGRRGRAGALF